MLGFHPFLVRLSFEGPVDAYVTLTSSRTGVCLCGGATTTVYRPHIVQLKWGASRRNLERICCEVLRAGLLDAERHGVQNLVLKGSSISG